MYIKCKTKKVWHKSLTNNVDWVFKEGLDGIPLYTKCGKNVKCNVIKENKPRNLCKLCQTR